MQFINEITNPIITDPRQITNLDKDFSKLTTPTIKNMKRTIEGFEGLSKKLFEEYNFESIVGKCLNQNCLENFFE